MDGRVSASSEMVTEVARERGIARVGKLVDDDDEEGKECSSVRRYVFPFKRSSSAGVKVLSL